MHKNYFLLVSLSLGSCIFLPFINLGITKYQLDKVLTKVKKKHQFLVKIELFTKNGAIFDKKKGCKFNQARL